MTDTAPQRPDLETLLDAWDELRSQGTEVDLACLTRDVPHLLPELQNRIAQLQAMDWLEPLVTDAPCDCGSGRPADRGDPAWQVPLLLAGRYRMENLIAAGGFGQVWRASDTALDRPVAIKVTDVPCVDEARRVARLKHHGIISVHDVGNHAGICFIVFDLVEGTNLAELLSQDPPTWQAAVRIVAQVAAHMHFAHQKGYIHRDIKPANILIDTDGFPVLADFGIAVTRQELEHEVATTLGTAAYMSPEQLSTTARIDHRTDIYSLGVVLYEALTRRLPHRGRTLWKLREQITSVPPDNLQALASHVPAAIAAIVMKCLEKDPAQRFQSAHELAESLLAARDGRTQP